MTGALLRRRARVDARVLTAALLAVLLTTTVAAAVALLHGAARAAAVSQVLESAPVSQRVVTVSADLEEDTDVAALDATVRDAVGDALSEAPAAVTLRTVSPSYALPGGGEDPDLTVFAAYDALAERARLVAGAWPDGSAADDPLEAALPQGAAEALGLTPGDLLTVTGRQDGDAVRVAVSGTFEIADPGAAAWVGDPLVRSGREAGAQFTTYGPLVVTPEVFAERFVDEAAASWVADPDLGRVGPADVDALSRGVDGLAAQLDGVAGVETELGAVVAATGTPLTATTAVLALAGAPLLLLGLGALLTAGRLLGDHRRVEDALVRARGVSARQLAGLALAEALLLAALAALAGPPLAVAVLRLLGPESLTGVGLGGGAWVAALLAGAAAAVVLVLPALRREDLAAAARSGGGRAAGIRSVGGLALAVGLAGVAAWQLERYGAPVRATGDGPAADPLLVLTPALLVLAASLLAVRLLPVVPAVLAPLAGRSRGLVGALATWQAGRRTTRLTGPVLSLVVACAVGVLALTWLRTADASWQEEAAFASGADLRVLDPESRLQPADVGGLPGVVSAVPVLRSQDSAAGTEVDVLALDTSDETWALAVPRPGAAPGPAIEVPAGTTALLVDGVPAGVVVVQDRFGLVHAVPLEDTEQQQGTAPLEGYAEPLALLGVRAESAAGATVRGDAEDLVVAAVVDGARRGLALEPPPGARWAVRTTPDGDRVATVLPADDVAAKGVPAVVSRDLAGTAGEEQLLVTVGDQPLRVDVTTVVDAVPTVDPRRAGAVVLDLRTAARAVFQRSGDVPPAATEWWLTVSGDPAGVVAALREAGAPAVQERGALATALASDPVGTALRGALGVGVGTAVAALVAAVVAAVGATARTRRDEASLLRALGVPRRPLTRVLLLDQAGFLLLAGAAGTGVGLAAGWWVLPRVHVTAAAASPYPPVDVVGPWAALAVAAAALLGGLAVVLPLWGGRLAARAAAPRQETDR